MVKDSTNKFRNNNIEEPFVSMKQRFFLFLNQYTKMLYLEIKTSLQYPVYFMIYISAVIFDLLSQSPILHTVVMLCIFIKMSIHDYKSYEIYESDQWILFITVLKPIHSSLLQLVVVIILWIMCKQEKLGCADVKLLISGLFIVEEFWIQSLFFSSVLAIVYASLFIKDKKAWIPFGPFIALSLWVFSK